MSQGSYFSIDKKKNHPFYDNVDFHRGNYTFDNLTYSIWEYKQNGEEMFLFSHPDNEVDKECGIYFKLQTHHSFNGAVNVFIDIFICDIGSGIGRKMLKAFMNYLLNNSNKKNKKHNFTGDTYICLTPGEIMDSKRLGNTITYDIDKLITYYRALGFNTNHEGYYALCGTIGNILVSIKREEDMITPAITRSGIVFRKPSRIIRKKKYYQNKPSRRRPTPTPTPTPPTPTPPTPTPTPPPTQSIFSGFRSQISSRFGFGGRKKQMTRKRSK
jgi:hypothetical protein